MAFFHFPSSTVFCWAWVSFSPRRCEPFTWSYPSLGVASRGRLVSCVGDPVRPGADGCQGGQGSGWTRNFLENGCSGWVGRLGIPGCGHYQRARVQKGGVAWESRDQVLKQEVAGRARATSDRRVPRPSWGHRGRGGTRISFDKRVMGRGRVTLDERVARSGLGHLRPRGSRGMGRDPL